MLCEVADCCGEGEAAVIRSVARALRGIDRDHVLILRQKKRGKYLNPAETRERYERNKEWLYHLASLERQGVKTEAAVEHIAAGAGVKRASIFEGVKEAESYLEQSRVFHAGTPLSEFFTNPRPGKNRKV